MCAFADGKNLWDIHLSLSPLAIIKLGANVVQAGRINTVGLTIDGFDQFLGSELLNTSSVQSQSSNPSRL